MDAGSSNFAVNGFDEVMVWHACMDECIEPLEHIVGIHVCFEFGQISRDSFSLLTGEASRRGSKCRDSCYKERIDIKVDVEATVIPGSAIEERFVDHVDN